jgi:AcrR family transcriptional regulator
LSSRQSLQRRTAIPRLANHAERRREVCEATWEVIARQGLEGTSLRAIALELGMTTGVLMHYFRDRDELLKFAIDEVLNGLEARIAKFAEGKAGLERLEGLLLASLPTDEKSRRGWKVWIAVTGATVGKELLIDQHRARYVNMRQRVIRELKDLQRSGAIDPRLRVTEEADALRELIDGVGVGWFIEPQRYSPARLREIVQRQLKRLSAVP